MFRVCSDSLTSQSNSVETLVLDGSGSKQRHFLLLSFHVRFCSNPPVRCWLGSGPTWESPPSWAQVGGWDGVLAHSSDSVLGEPGAGCL